MLGAGREEHRAVGLGGRYYASEENRIGWSRTESLRRGRLSRGGKEWVTSLDQGKAWQAEGTADAQVLRPERKSKTWRWGGLAHCTPRRSYVPMVTGLYSNASISGKCWFFPHKFSDLLGTNVQNQRVCTFHFILFWLRPRHVEVPRPGIKPTPEQPPNSRL